MNDTFEVSTKTQISRETISDLLCTAFEGGSTYWVNELFIMKDAPDSMRPDDFSGYASEHGAYGGILKIFDNEAETTYLLSDTEIQRGLNRMAEDHCHHWMDLINENMDADTADVFLQCCVFGEVVYG